MKIIGIVSSGYGAKVLAEVSREEVEKVMGKYFGPDKDKLPEFKVGDVIDLGKGHDFRREIQSTCADMIKAEERFHSAQKLLLAFAQMVQHLPAPTEPTS